MADLLMTCYIHYKVYENIGLKKVYENTEVMLHNPQVNIDSSITNLICHFAHPLMLSQLASTG
jgi:hypothetical protein